MMTSLENRQKTSRMIHCAVILIRRTNDKQKYEKDCSHNMRWWRISVIVCSSYRDGFPVGQSGRLSKVYRLTPLLANNRVQLTFSSCRGALNATRDSG